MAEEEAQKPAPDDKPAAEKKPEAAAEKKPETAASKAAANKAAGDAVEAILDSEKAPEAPGKTIVRKPKGAKKGWKAVTFAKVYIQSTFNNTMVTITDDRGATLCWASAGGSGFKGTKKGTPFAAQMTAQKAAKRAVELGVKQVTVFVKGPGPGRETAIRALQQAGLQVVSLKDVSPIPHNGCRAPKARRV
ncbi:MAG: 30S ribosomal protein S11 [Elusimicrobia bacterium]|nr:MAG: 30S ribosomal protein S11 [Elusimicrobiota bacterium]